MGHLLKTVKGPDVIKSVYAWTESSMKTEDLTIHKGSQGKVVKQVSEVLPHIGIAVFSQTLIVEAVHLCDLARLVVAPKNCDSLPESYFQSHQQSYRFDTVVASVDIVAHEEVICVRRLATNTEKLHKVVELTMYVATYSHRTFHLLDVALLAQNLLCLFTEGFHLVFGQLLALHELFHPPIQLLHRTPFLRTHLGQSTSQLWFDTPPLSLVEVNQAIK